MIRSTLRATAGAILTLLPGVLTAQSLERRVAQVREGDVEFHYAARDGVCGDGKYFMRVDANSWHGTINDMTRAAPCETGPVRLVLTRSDGVTIRLRTYAGPLQSEPGATNLGRVSTREATAFLMDMAQSVDARTGRDAIFPASVADSTAISPMLLEIAQNPARPREVRRTALSYLAQRAGEPGGVTPRAAGQRLGAIARDESDNQEVRQQALSSLLRLEEGGGFAALQELALQPNDAWLSRAATRSLAQSGDPRAREFLRRAAGRSDLPGEARVAAISGLGGSYGSAADAAFLREIYPRLDSERQRDAALTAIASIGGSANGSWLLNIARGDTGAVQQRRKAVQMAERAGATVQEFIALYDAVGDSEIRSAIIDALARDGSRPAVDKLLSIARSDTQHTQRRRAISALGKFDDVRVKEALRSMVERPR
jgi:HEAT repeat protein